MVAVPKPQVPAVDLASPAAATAALRTFWKLAETWELSAAEQVRQRIPAGRVGVDDDMAGAAIYLASRAGDYVVGSTLVVDGGVTHAR